MSADALTPTREHNDLTKLRIAGPQMPPLRPNETPDQYDDRVFSDFPRGVVIVFRDGRRVATPLADPEETTGIADLVYACGAGLDHNFTMLLPDGGRFDYATAEIERVEAAPVEVLACEYCRIRPATLHDGHLDRLVCRTCYPADEESSYEMEFIGDIPRDLSPTWPARPTVTGHYLPGLPGPDST